MAEPNERYEDPAEDPAEGPVEEDIFGHSEQDEIWYPRMLAEFEEKFWPYYKQRGYSKDTALLHFTLDDAREQLAHLKRHLMERGL